MKKLISGVVAVTTAVLFTACGSGPRMMDANDTSANPRSMQSMTSEDWVEISAKMGDSLLKSNPFDEYLESYREDAVEAYRKDNQESKAVPSSVKRAKPLLMLSRIENKTDEYINTQLLTERLSEQMFNSGKVRVTTAAAGAGQHIDQASAQARELRNDPNFKKSTVLKKGTLNAYDLSLSGTIIKQKTNVGRDRTLSYFFSMILTDNRNGEVVWKKTEELKRGDTKPAIGW